MNSLSWLDFFTIAMSVYVILECFSAVCNMPQGWRLCWHKLKFIMGFSSACVLIYYALQDVSEEIQWLILGMAGTLASFVWPRMVWRINAFLEDIQAMTDWG